jgi:hypothetical protein
VSGIVWQRAVNTAFLATAAIVLATLIGIPLGVFTGTRRGLASGLVRAGSIVLLSLPPLVTSLLLVVIAARTQLLPAGGMTSMDVGEGTVAWIAVGRAPSVPALALALPLAAMWRLQSQAMRDAVAGRCAPPGARRARPGDLARRCFASRAARWRRSAVSSSARSSADRSSSNRDVVAGTQAPDSRRVAGARRVSGGRGVAWRLITGARQRAPTSPWRRSIACAWSRIVRKLAFALLAAIAFGAGAAPARRPTTREKFRAWLPPCGSRARYGRHLARAIRLSAPAREST